MGKCKCGHVGVQQRVGRGERRVRCAGGAWAGREGVGEGEEQVSGVRECVSADGCCLGVWLCLAERGGRERVRRRG